MPEGSGLDGANAEVWIVWTSVGCTILAAEAGDAGQSSAPDAATKTAHTKRRMPADDACRTSLGESARCSPVSLMPRGYVSPARFAPVKEAPAGAQGRGSS